ncbi:MAG: hypothetical protein QM621_06805 [Aeromicrobium sp.]|uniref:hypothetical protein n=1 Tax=Aeromicrobium sp. TaxID=1871063 RepID=UPI0039E4C2B7
MIVLRPDVERYRTWLGRPDLMVVGLVVGVVVLPLSRALVEGDARGTLTMVASILIAVLLSLLSVTAYLRTATVTLTAETIEYRRLFVRRTVLPREGLRGILTIYSPSFSAQDMDLLVLQRDSGRGAKIRINGAAWRRADLSTIARHARVATIAGPVDAREVEARVPGILQGWERRPVLWVVGGGIALPLVLFVIGVVVLVVLELLGVGVVS